jgi:2-keto-3-deoxy-L-rhamnonate aldolase RhmA
MLATAGLDYFVFDMEHGPFDWSDMAAMIATARGAGIAPMVRCGFPRSPGDRPQAT